MGDPERHGTGGAAGASAVAAPGRTVGSDHPSGTSSAKKVPGAASPTPATGMPSSMLPPLAVASPSTVSASATRTVQEALDESDPSDNTSSNTRVNNPFNNGQGTPFIIALGPVVSDAQDGGASGGRASSISPRGSNAPASQNEPAPAPPAAQLTPAPQTSQSTPAPQAPRVGLRSTPPPPLPEAQGLPHSVVQQPGPAGRYTTYDKFGPQLQYRGSGKAHGDIPRPNVKVFPRNEDPNGVVRPGTPIVRPALPEEIPPIIEDPIIP